MRGRPAPQRTIVIDGKPLSEALDEAMVQAGCGRNVFCNPRQLSVA